MTAIPPATGSGLPSMSWSGLSRRRFLKSALLVAGAGSSGLALQACAPEAATDSAGRPFMFLDRGEAALLHALGEAIVPTQAGFPTLDEAQVVRRADEEMAMSDPSVQGDLHAALAVLQWMPLAYGHGSRYTKLSLPRRRKVLQRMMRSNSEVLRAVATNLKILVHFFYFGHRASWAAIGYEGPFANLPPSISEQRGWYAQKTAPRGGDLA
jgi:hypothetical protein